MVPPSTRRRISTTSSRIAQIVISGAFWGGKGIYVLSTGLLMVGIPWALAFVDDQQAMEVEQEQKAREAAGEVSWIFYFSFHLKICFRLLILFYSLHEIFLSFGEKVGFTRESRC